MSDNEAIVRDAHDTLIEACWTLDDVAEWVAALNSLVAERDEWTERAAKCLDRLEKSVASLHLEIDRRETAEAERNAFASVVVDAESRAQAAEAEVARLRGEIEDYMLWEPGRAGHAAAHARLRAALAAPTKEEG